MMPIAPWPYHMQACADKLDHELDEHGNLRSNADSAAVSMHC